MWEEGIGGRSQEEVTGRTVMGEWIRENTIGRCDREDGNARVELGECDRGDGRDCGGVSTPGHGQGEGPARYEFRGQRDEVDCGRGRSERSERSPPQSLPSPRCHRITNRHAIRCYQVVLIPRTA
jgi:hypothetical protein